MPDEEEKYLNNKEELLDQITVFLAGRAAEEIVFNTQTTGASNDIERATDMARKMITMFGMSDKFGLVGLESVQNRYLDGRAVANCSEETRTEIDREIVKIMKERYEIAKRLLNENRDALDEISEFLIDKETITGDEFMEIFDRVREKRNQPQESNTESEDGANEDN
jgi:cell division protease FtsH